MIAQRWRHPVGPLILCGLLAGCQAGSPVGGRYTARQDHTLEKSGPAVLKPLPPVDLGVPPLDPQVPPVILASYAQPVETLPAPTQAPQESEQETEVAAAADAIDLHDVIRSVRESYPLLVAAQLERRIAEGKRLAAWGEFDVGAKGFGIAAPEGYYRTYRHGMALDWPLFSGGYVYGGYKIGRGNFQPWFKERKTNKGGEFSVGVGVPLLKDRAIDKRRASVFQARLDRRAVDPAVRGEWLEFVRLASHVYWSWVAAGQTVAAQRELLRNAQARVEQIDQRVDAGDLQRIARINNRQLIAARETKVIEAERKLQQAAIKLSLFYRSPEGEPTVPHESRLPTTFPRDTGWDRKPRDAELEMAIDASPELEALDLMAAQVNLELREAENLLLPKVDARVLASKDVGLSADPNGDKTPFELETGLFGELPLQRREARGKIAASRGKLSQIRAKREFVVDKITAAVADSVSALEAAAGRIDRAWTNLRLARETQELGRIQFEAGDIDLVALNIYEQQVTDAQLLLIAAQADFFSAQADYRAALSLDPLADE